MRNLISAQFARLFKCKFFYICLFLYFAVGIYFSATSNFFYFENYDYFFFFFYESALSLFTNNVVYPMQPPEDGVSLIAYLNNDFLRRMNTIYVYMDSLIQSGYYCFGIFSAIIITLIVGGEFSNGTIRNKIICGHSRKSVYLSNLVVSIVSDLIIQISYIIGLMIPICILCIKYSSTEQYIDFGKPLKAQLINNMIGIGTILVYCSLFLFIAMITSSQSRTAASSILVIAVFILLSMLADQKLYQFEYVDNSTGSNEETFSYMNIYFADDSQYNDYAEFRDSMRGKNLNKAEAVFYCFLDDTLPTSQIYKLEEADLYPPRSKSFIISDYSFAVIITALGIVMFNKKDIK